MVDAQDFRHEVRKFTAVGFQKEEIGQHLFRPFFTGGKSHNARRIGENIFQGDMAFCFFQRQFFSLSADEVLMGLKGGEGTGRKIFFSEKGLLQVSCLMGEEEIMETTAEISQSFAGEGMDGGHETGHGGIFEVGFFKILQAGEEVSVFFLCVPRFCQEEEGIEIRFLRRNAPSFQIG